ncbi:MAG: hypothetical protein ABSE64_10645 [Vulcanimicrobiaceae bacterium]
MYVLKTAVVALLMTSVAVAQTDSVTFPADDKGEADALAAGSGFRAAARTTIGPVLSGRKRTRSTIPLQR